MNDDHIMKAGLKLIAGALLLAVHGAIAATPAVGTLETVAELPIRPGNVTATADGRVFATVHPLDRPSGVQLIEVTGPDSYRPWPDATLQSPVGEVADARLDTLLGITQDRSGHLWVVDMGLQIGKTRVWGFDIDDRALHRKLELPADIAPSGSFVQDLAVDDARGWVYLADIAVPALIAVDIDSGHARRFEHPLLAAEPDATMRVDGAPTMFNGAPAAVGVNPITLSADGETLYFGAMNGTHWYALPAQLLRDGAADADIAAAIETVGRKPVSDGAATDDAGHHFFTNLNDDGIDRLDPDGRLTPLVRDARLDWPDSVQFGDASWLYISVNQLHRSVAFTGGADSGRPPYRIMRVWTGTGGVDRDG